MVHEALRKAREARGLSLAALETKAGVRVAVLDAIERGAYAELPSGLYGRHAVRAYASAVGLDANRVLEEVGALLPKPEDPLNGLARVRGFPRRIRQREGDQDRGPRSAVAECLVPGAMVPECLGSRPDDRRPASAFRDPKPGIAGLADDVSEPFDWRPAAAAAIDGALLAIVALALAKLTAVAAGTDVPDLIALALPAWALIAALISSAYFVLLGGVRNATLGAAAVGARTEPSEPLRLDARSAVRRGLQCALRESSILVEWLLANGQSSGWLRALTHRG